MWEVLCDRFDFLLAIRKRNELAALRSVYRSENGIPGVGRLSPGSNTDVRHIN